MRNSDDPRNSINTRMNETSCEVMPTHEVLVTQLPNGHKEHIDRALSFYAFKAYLRTGNA